MQGLILIPDITGFTNFVKEINIEDGVSITHELLSEIIDHNVLGLQLSEIEGDAVLFYKVGEPIPMEEMLDGINTMYEAFERKYHALKLQYDIQSELSLKFILHYGDMDVYEIRGFTKLYGQTIIESHRLLKNGSTYSSYILITEDYVKALGTPDVLYIPGKGNFPLCFSEFISGLREITYYFFHFPPKDANAFQYSLQ
jgi:hypothetical protein